MDLRGILNTSDNGERPPAPPAATTPSQPHPPRPQQPPLPHHPQYQSQMVQSPSTPSQVKQSYFHDYPHPHQASPGKGPHPDYPLPPQRQQSMSYHSPYQSPAAYPPRPGPPSLQGPPYSDPRSPAAVARPPPSFGRASTTPLPVGAQSGGYFSGAHTPTEMASPVQPHQQYPPQNIHPGGRDGYGPQSQPGGPPAPSGSYLQSPVAQTPSTPGAPGPHHPYPHQRSQSIHSLTNTSTPTSAQSQHPPPFGPSAFHHQPQPQQQQQQPQPGQQQRSPVATNRPPIPFNKQPSQASSAAPIPAPARQSSDISAGFGHPSSPHSQRMPSVGPTVPQQQPQPPPQLHSQHQPPPPASGHPPAMPSRLSSAHTSPVQHHSDLRASQSRSDRERSISVSPKTHVPSLPGNLTHSVPAAGDPQHQLAAPAPVKADSTMTPAKRKMDDRGDDEQADRREVRQRQDDGVNGKPEPTTPHQAMSGAEEGRLRSSVSPKVEKRRRKPKRYNEPPPWALSASNAKLKHANFAFPKKPAGKASPVNGKPPAVKQQSRHASPEAARAPPPPAAPPAPTPVDPNSEITALLGPWEPTIANVKPLDEINKAVADFLFLNVINNPNAEEIASLGIAFEIEAKLGKVIDKDTNERVAPMVASECVLDDRGRFGFQSNMTEAQHKALNDYLNHMVLLADPRNPESKSRVQLHYKHRREVDKYFDLAPPQRELLPGCVRSLLRPRQGPRARVTYDQRTKEVLAKIVKARVADMHVHMPNSPVDCRLSVNLEMDWPGPVEELEAGGGGNPPRQKDRLSYAQGSIQVDLTQVSMATSGAPRGKDHELEIELSPGIVVEQGRRLMSGEAHKYPELVESFVDNIRLLARKVNEFR